MIYNFSKKYSESARLYFYYVNSTTDSVLEKFYSHDWTISLIQEIIDGVNAGRNKPRAKPYEWSNDNIDMISNQYGVFMIDRLAMRAGAVKPEELEYKFTHDEMNKFLEDFKKFVAENS